MPGTATCTTIQQVPVAVTGLAADGTTSVPLSALTITTQSGDGTSVVNDAGSFTAVSGSAVGDTVYTVVGSQAGGADVTDTFTLTVTADTTVPVATTLVFTPAAAQPKAGG